MRRRAAHRRRRRGARASPATSSSSRARSSTCWSCWRATPGRVVTREDADGRRLGRELVRLDEDARRAHRLAARASSATTPAAPRCIQTVRGVGFRFARRRGSGAMSLRDAPAARAAPTCCCWRSSRSSVPLGAQPARPRRRGGARPGAQPGGRGRGDRRRLLAPPSAARCAALADRRPRGPRARARRRRARRACSPTARAGAARRLLRGAARDRRGAARHAVQAQRASADARAATSSPRRCRRPRRAARSARCASPRASPRSTRRAAVDRSGSALIGASCWRSACSPARDRAAIARPIGRLERAAGASPAAT